MVKVYLISQINDTSRHTLKRSIDECNLICRRIFTGGGIPFAPALWFVSYNKDPRLRKTDEWWLRKIYIPLMKECSIMCYKPNLVGTNLSIVKAEKDAWRKCKPNTPEVSSDMILDFLLNYNAEEVLRGNR